MTNTTPTVAGLDTDEAVDLLRGMVDIPSATGREEMLAQYLASWCRQRDLRARLQPLGPGRANVIATLEGSGGGSSLMFNGHLDTSYTGEEEFLNGIGYKPHAVVRDGWLFGLGAVNMKSGLAAAFMVLRILAKRQQRLPGDVLVTGVSGEIEKTCIDDFQGSQYTGYGYGTVRLLAHAATADYGINCEPTNFKSSHGQLGALWVKITLYGDMRHTTFFDERTNDHAIYNSYRIVEAIRLWGRDYQERNAYLGQPACIHVGSIQGGWPWRISRTPFSCSMYVDVRINPTQRPEAVLQELKSVVWSAFPEGREGRRIEIDPYVIVPSVMARGDEPVFGAIQAAHQAVFGQPPALEFRGPMADSVHMNAAGIPTVTYGIGPGGNFDAVNPETGEVGEQVRIADYLKLIGIYLDAAQRVCGGGTS